MTDIVHAVFDTNILVSGLLWEELPFHALELAADKKFQLVTSSKLLDELEDVLSRQKFTSRLNAKGKKWIELVNDITRLSFIVEPVDIHPVVLDDPDDDVLIATALATPVDCIVAGNRHLLDVGEYQRIPIYRVEQFLRLFDLRS